MAASSCASKAIDFVLSIERWVILAVFVLLSVLTHLVLLGSLFSDERVFVGVEILVHWIGTLGCSHEGVSVSTYCGQTKEDSE